MSFERANKMTVEQSGTAAVLAGTPTIGMMLMQGLVEIAVVLTIIVIVYKLATKKAKTETKRLLKGLKKGKTVEELLIDEDEDEDEIDTAKENELLKQKLAKAKKKIEELKTEA